MEQKNSRKKIFSIIGNIICGGLFVVALLILILGIISHKQGKQLKFFGYSFSTVVTPSMEDTIKVNDIIVFKDIPFENIKVNDIIVYYNDEYHINVVHRVVGINEDGSLVTKGDNNNSVDAIYTTSSNYVGKVVKYGSFLGIGKLARNNKNIIFAIIFLIFLYILIVAIQNIFKVNKEKAELEFSKKQETINETKLREEIRKEIEEENRK
ncbi:MAG: signal peptidase I [Bacilli bacterium]|nr:signal peptidase I [Acholeplasmataceae bacterium]MDY2903034.1 signal peptidase I [Bacilli bacterium]